MFTIIFKNYCGHKRPNPSYNSYRYGGRSMNLRWNLDKIVYFYEQLKVEMNKTESL